VLKVFLAEDESIIRRTLRDNVPWEKYGYSVVGEASDGELALPLIRQTKPDVLITDIRMPFLDGLELSRMVLQELPGTKVIIISGYDDFEYARRAISIGVEQYLLKPVTKSNLLGALDEIREKIESERSQSSYLARFHLEAQEYEQYARRRFFEQIVFGQLSEEEIYAEAAQLELDLNAQRYTIAFFSVPPAPFGPAQGYSECDARVQEAILEHFLKRPEEYLLLRWNMNTCAVLIKCSEDSFDGCVHSCIDAISTQYRSCSPEPDWYVAVGPMVCRLAELPSCFDKVARLWSHRYIVPTQHILTAEALAPLAGTGSRIRSLDVTRISPSILLGAIRSAGVDELQGFVEQYIESASVGLDFKPFWHYIMLNVRYTALQYALTLGVTKADFLAELPPLERVAQITGEAELSDFIYKVLLAAVNLRERTSSNRSHGVLAHALRYIDENYTQENLSLNRVASQINISPNYLSAMFSQEMGCTLTEYITSRRMEKAKEILRTTDMRSGEIAFALGYRDPHYFSFLFKKTQGCTPRDYRAGKGGV